MGECIFFMADECFIGKEPSMERGITEKLKEDGGKYDYLE